MKPSSGKLGVILVVIGLATFAYSEGWGADWTIFPGIASGNHYYDAESINRLPNNIVRVWVKVNFNPFGGMWASLHVYGKTGKKDVPIGTSLSLIEFNCVERQFRIMKESFYHEKGGEVYSESGTGKWDYIMPASEVRLSMEDSLLKIVCK